MPWKAIRDMLGLGEGRGLRALLDALAGGSSGAAGPRGQVAFTIAVVSLAAKMSKADGVSTRIEARVFDEVFKAEPADLAAVRRLFDLARQDVAGFEAHAARLARLLDGDRDLKRGVFEGLFHIAAADGVLHPLEDRYLARVGEIFGLAPAEQAAIRARFVADPADPYVVLGAERATGDEELRRRYRALVRECHPDALVARGVPPELVRIADRKLAAINAAWEAIARERGL
jgi:DnaJ like chaperone protein